MLVAGSRVYVVSETLAALCKQLLMAIHVWVLLSGCVFLFHLSAGISAAIPTKLPAHIPPKLLSSFLLSKYFTNSSSRREIFYPEELR